MGNWVQVFTGRGVDVFDMRPEDIDIEDIAHSLSMQCRFGGHCSRFYSVAQHSVHVSRLVEKLTSSQPMWRKDLMREGLLHDAAEAYVLDLPRPIKHDNALREYRELELGVARAIFERFGLLDPKVLSDVVEEADEIMLATEAAQLMKKPPHPWNLRCAPLAEALPAWSPEESRREFLSLYRELFC